MLFVGAANLLWLGYGEAFLQLMASIYPGYHAAGSPGNLTVGTLYALLDGAICGWVFGWLYNLFIRKESSALAAADSPISVRNTAVIHWIKWRSGRIPSSQGG